ncbi:MAG: universal stress protein [Phototrophicaceae bacterium]
MLNHILIPLDGSALSEQALTTAQNLVAPNTRIVLLSILELPADYEFTLLDVPMTAITARQYSKEEYNIAEERVKDYLASIERRLVAKGFQVDCVVESGDPATVINEVANKHNVDSIIMTTHGRTGLNRWLFGSVTQKVISHMLRPVMVVPSVQTVKADKLENVGQQIPATS